MEIGSIVIVSLTSPREKIWGQLLLLEAKGVTMRGIELDAFDDFIRQVIKQEETAVGIEYRFLTHASGGAHHRWTSPAVQFLRCPSDSTPKSD